MQKILGFSIMCQVPIWELKLGDNLIRDGTLLWISKKLLTSSPFLCLFKARKKLRGFFFLRVVSIEGKMVLKTNE